MWDMKSKWMIFILALAGISCAGTLSLEESLAPYSGPVESNTNHSTLHGTVMCGYQGWFTHQDDGGGTGNFHWGDVTRNPPRCSVDLWPDMLELAPEEKFPTNYRHADGSTAYVFSSTVNPPCCAISSGCRTTVSTGSGFSGSPVKSMRREGCV